MKRILFIVNPASAGGKTKARWQEAERLFKDAAQFDFDVKLTEKKSDAIFLAKAATESKAYHMIVSVGGDGTANEVVNGIMQGGETRDERPIFAVFPSGTGSDLVRTLGMPAQLEAFLQILHDEATIHADVGQVNYETETDGLDHRYFINISDIGIGAAVTHTVNQINQGEKQKFGKAKYFSSILKQVIKFKAFDATLKTQAEALTVNQTVTMCICNGMFFGGGVKMSPTSKIDDGKLELVASKGVSKMGLLGLVGKVYSGAHIYHKGVMLKSHASFEIEAHQPRLMQTDGEVLGVVKKARFEVLEGVLEVLVKR